MAFLLCSFNLSLRGALISNVCVRARCFERKMNNTTGVGVPFRANLRSDVARVLTRGIVRL